MGDGHKSDDELIVAYQRWWTRWWVISVVFGIVFFFLMIAWFNFVLTHHPFVSLGFTPQAGQELIVVIPMIIAVCGAYALRIVFGRPPGMQNEQSVRKTADDHYARLRWFYPLITFAIAPALFVPQVQFFGRLDFGFYLLIFALIVQAMWILRVFGWSASFRRGLDDELSRALRAKASQFGYGLTLAVLAIACIYARYRPVSAEILLLQILFVASMSPMLCFIFLEWQSGRDG